jgi:hypothetical protein
VQAAMVPCRTAGDLEWDSGSAPPAPQAEGSLKNTHMMADLARRAAVLWMDLRAAAAADRPAPDECAALAAYNAAHLGFVRKDPDNSARHRAGLVPGLHIYKPLLRASAGGPSCARTGRACHMRVPHKPPGFTH